jgi:DNA-binding transcriptional regulator LsrR (DeoR family)
MGKDRMTPEERKALVFRLCHLFFVQGLNVSEIAAEINKELNFNLSREQIYPLLAQAMKLELISLQPPVNKKVAAEVAKKFELNAERIRVVNVSDKWGGEHVAAEGARWVLDLLKEIAGSEHKPVRLGLGPGRATLDFSRHLGRLLESDVHPPRLKLIAISAGAPPRSPAYASVSFFNLFPNHLVDEYMGLFAEPMVPANEFDKIKERPLVKDAFDLRDAVDIVVTGMGDINDEHDLLRRFLEDCRYDIGKLKDAGWKGNVQYRPYTSTKAIVEGAKQMRAVTLFELDDFVRIAGRRDKRVVLIARQCGVCGMTRANALRPLLTEKALKVWSELVMDMATARELLGPDESQGTVRDSA